MASQNITSELSPLIQGIKFEIERQLGKLIADYFDNAELAISSATSPFATDPQYADRFECLRAMKIDKHNIESGYIDNIRQLLRPFPITEAEKKQQKPDAEDELSLVDHSDIEDMVQIKNMGERVASNCREQISHLEARLEYVALKTDDIFQKRALSPVNLCQAFDDALGNNFNAHCKKLLFRLFNDNVAIKLDGLYNTINNRLIDAGILPQIKVQKLNKPRSKHRYFSGQGPQDEQKAASQPENSPRSQPPSSESGDATEQADNIGKGYAMKAAPGTSYQSQSTPTRKGALATSIPTEQIAQALNSFLGSSVNRTDEGGGVFPESTPQAFGHEEILSALSNMQSSQEFQHPSDLHFDAEAVKTALVNEIAKKSGGVVTKRINELATKTIDFIELIFDAIIEDDAISDAIKALLLRLQIPIIKASLLDPEFFIQDTHPARVLLDRITEVGFGVTDHQDETYIELENVVSVIQNEYELQTSTFQKALDRLNAYVEKQEAIAREKEEAAQKQVLREHARNTVLKALRTITSGRNLPESIHPLVLKRWPTLMFNHYLTNGKDNDEWITIIEALRDIVTSVQPITTVDELAYLKNHRLEIMKRTHHYLKITNRSEQDIEDVLQGLRSVHDNLIESAHFDTQEIESAQQKLSHKEAVAPETKPPAAPEKETEATTPTTHLPAEVVPGTWFLIYMGDDKATRRAKLSVIIIEDSKLVFVNHSGDIIVEKSFDEFTNELKEGKSRVIMGHSVFDHALHSVIGHIQRR